MLDYRTGIILDLDASVGLYTNTARTAPVTADGQIVLGIADQSGAGNHATQYLAVAGLQYFTQAMQRLDGTYIPSFGRGNDGTARVLTLGKPASLDAMASSSTGYSLSFVLAGGAPFYKGTGGFDRIGFYDTAGEGMYNTPRTYTDNLRGPGVGRPQQGVAAVFTYSPTGPTESWYVNGKLVSTRVASVPAWDTTYNWMLGGWGGDGSSAPVTQSNNFYFNSIRIYDHALDAPSATTLCGFLDARLGRPTATSAARLLIVGDSIAYGFGVTQTTSYAGITAAAIPAATSANLATPGITAARLLEQTPTLHAAYVGATGQTVSWVHCGSNDLARGDSPATVYAARKAIATSLTAAGAKVALASVLPRNTGFSNGVTSASFETARQALATLEWADFNAATATTRIYGPASGTTWARLLVDVGADPTMGVSTAPANNTLYLDGIHPTTLGHASIATGYSTPAAMQLLDTSPPSVPAASIDSTGTFLTITFNESVTGVAASDYTLSGGETLTNATGSGATWTVAVSPAVYVGRIRLLSYVGTGTVDASGNPLGKFAATPVTNNSTFFVGVSPTCTAQTATTATLAANPTGLVGPQYAWTTTSGPGGAEFGNSASATPTVRYPSRGFYEHKVVATGTDGVRRENSLCVVVRPVVTRGVLLPSSGNVEMSTDATRLSANWYDQFDRPIAAEPTWSISGVGAISQAGEFTSSSVGASTITATVGSVSASTILTVVSHRAPSEG